MVQLEHTEAAEDRASPPRAHDVHNRRKSTAGQIGQRRWLGTGRPGRNATHRERLALAGRRSRAVRLRGRRYELPIRGGAGIPLLLGAEAPGAAADRPWSRRGCGGAADGREDREQPGGVGMPVRAADRCVGLRHGATSLESSVTDPTEVLVHRHGARTLPRRRERGRGAPHMPSYGRPVKVSGSGPKR